MNKILFLIITTLCFTACMDDINIWPAQGNELCGGEYKSRTIQNDDIYDIVVYGYTTKEDKSNIKLLFDNKLAEGTGLQSGSVYIVRYERYTKEISLNNQMFFDSDENPDCGLKSMSDIAHGGYVSHNRGYNQISQNDNRVILECYLLHIVSDLSGHALNIYYPCTPNKIEWKGLIYNL